jgi:hypothetical protein
MSPDDHSAPELNTGTLLRFWFPLAASWLLMSTETPLVTAVVARLPGSKLHLAAFGVAFSLALMVESPVIPMLTAGNALARDPVSFHLVRRFMLGLCVVLTAAMLLLGFTPLFGLVVLRIIGAPEEIAEIVRPALWMMISWPAAIAYRRFYQGIMIRHGYTRQMSYGTLLRLSTTLIVALLGLFWGRLGGATVAGLALGCAVIAEAVYVGFASRRAVRQVLSSPLPQGVEGLTLAEMVRFYLPLLLTSMLALSTTPILNFGMVRSPWPVESLAAWPIVNGQLAIVRSLGFSMQEVVVALLDGPSAMRKLRRLMSVLGAGALLAISALAFTSFGSWWLERVFGLSQELTGFAIGALRWALLLPTLATFLSWLRGVIVTRKATGVIARATVANLVALGVGLWVGVQTGWLPGASLAALALTVSSVVESLWLGFSARSIRAWDTGPATVRLTSESGRTG